MFENPKERKKKFESLMEKEGMEERLPKLSIPAARYYPLSGGPFKMKEFKSKTERDKWYQEIGKGIEQEDGGRVEFYDELEK